MFKVGSIVYVTEHPEWGWAVVEELAALRVAGQSFWKIRFFDDNKVYTWAERDLILA